MQRVAWIVVALAACHTRSTSLSPDAASLETCEAAFAAAVETACGSAADCVLVNHLGCCQEVEYGVASSDAANVAESTYDACVSRVCGARGCDSPTVAEDGSPLTAGHTIVATCSAGQCGSTVQ